MPAVQITLTDSPIYQTALNAICGLPSRGVALLIGASDQGKTTFAAYAARELASAMTNPRERIAVVDSDIGTSEIGPPGTVGVAWAETGRERLHDLRPAALFFAGALTPRAVPLEWLAATVAAIRWAQAAGAGRIIVDTPGDVSGPGPRRLFAALALACAPSAIIGFHGAGENLAAARVAATMTGVGTASVLTMLPSSPDTRKRSIPQRALLRQTRLSIALIGGRELNLPMGDDAASGDASGKVQTIGTVLGTGAAMPPHLTRWVAETLHLPASAMVRAEIADETLTVFIDADAVPVAEAMIARNSGIIAGHFGVKRVRAIHLGAAVGTCVGLIGDEGRLLALARFECVDADAGALRVFASGISASDSDAVSRVRAVHFGRFRIGRDGTFQGDLRPGEI